MGLSIASSLQALGSVVIVQVSLNRGALSCECEHISRDPAPLPLEILAVCLLSAAWVPWPWWRETTGFWWQGCAGGASFQFLHHSTVARHHSYFDGLLLSRLQFSKNVSICVANGQHHQEVWMKCLNLWPSSWFLSRWVSHVGNSLAELPMVRLPDSHIGYFINSLLDPHYVTHPTEYFPGICSFNSNNPQRTEA